MRNEKALLFAWKRRAWKDRLMEARPTTAYIRQQPYSPRPVMESANIHCLVWLMCLRRS